MSVLCFLSFIKYCFGGGDHLSDTSSIEQHLKINIYVQQQNYGKHNKQNLQILEALYIRNIQLKLNRINFETSANVLKRLQQLTLFIEKFSKRKRYTIQQYGRSFSQSYKVNTKVTSLL